VASVVSSVRRTEIDANGTVGVVFEPVGKSDHFVVMLGGSNGGIPESPARRLAEHGLTAFALGYHGAQGLPSALVEIPSSRLSEALNCSATPMPGDGPSA
jgi:hypothetical protein